MRLYCDIRFDHLGVVSGWKDLISQNTTPAAGPSRSLARRWA
uniref:Uncharacterized protein n=1 Tax=Arundo donax TaxID=35708 RepID=A0A0A9DHY8_ARUDO